MFREEYDSIIKTDHFYDVELAASSFVLADRDFIFSVRIFAFIDERPS
jgi:hypothetical protein